MSIYSLTDKDAAILSEISYAVELFYKDSASSLKDQTLDSIFYNSDDSLKNERSVQKLKEVLN
ncbi:hypothetical protein [Francisella frigiditurris]|uniref:Uncharacterized protein n=1 Tax=Francisella frigiditurris TaxID=1542390 RepID=A0A1J0KVA2_9GAMM|nr:hypothetical protein [Francisella frigiditurris]APC97558.1 hypothetical protein KX01_335 [Francisella frigiditurris]